MKRISRGTPYVLSRGDIENALASLTPRTEEAIAALFGISVDQWRRQTSEVKCKQVIDFQNSAALAATLAAGARVHTDLESAAFAVTQATEAQTLAEEVRALREMVQELTHRPAAKRGAVK